MTVEILICRPDGTQTFETRELPDNWFDPVPESRAEKKAETEK